MNASPTVWLVGMMGAGKSEVGARVARRLGCRFVDTDVEIEREARCRISEIFAEEGEAGFRVRERTAIEGLCGEAAVVALGGGAIAQPGAAERLAASGVVVYLRARPETLLSRIGDGQGRPLLAALSPRARLARVRELLAARAAAYETAALVVDTDDLSLGEAAERVAAALAGARSQGAA